MGKQYHTSGRGLNVCHCSLCGSLSCLKVFQFVSQKRNMPEDHGVKLTYGREAAEDFFLLRFPTPEDAVDFMRRFRNHPALAYKDGETEHKIYISLNKYGRSRLLEMFTKKAAKILRSKAKDFGLEESVEIMPSYNSGGILIQRIMAFNVIVSQERNAKGYYDVSLRSRKEAEKLPKKFPLEEFEKVWKAECRL